MEEERVAELRKFLTVVTSPVIAGFIDLKKLSKSPEFSQAVDMAAEHAQRHGDFSYINNIMALLDGSAYAIEFLNLLHPKLNFVLAENEAAQADESQSK